MQQHLIVDAEPMQFRQHPLRLSEGVAEQQRGPIRRPPPPVHDLLGHGRAAAPAVDGQPEGGLGDQHIRRNGLKGGAARVGAAFVVAAHQPAFTAGLQPDLGTAEHVAGGVERHPGIADPMHLAVVHRDQVDALPQSLPQDALRLAHGPVGAAARPGVVGMAMGDQSARHRPPRVDPGLGRPAVEALGGELQQAARGEGHRRSAGLRRPAAIVPGLARRR